MDFLSKIFRSALTWAGNGKKQAGLQMRVLAGYYSTCQETSTVQKGFAKAVQKKRLWNSDAATSNR